MKCTTTKLWVNKLRKVPTKNGGTFWSFSTSLGKYTRGKNKGKYKGNLSMVCFDSGVQLVEGRPLENVEFDLISEEHEGKTYFKGILNNFKGMTKEQPKQEPKEEELVNVDDEFPTPDEDFKTTII